MANRLHLNFNLQYREERVEFLENYLKRPEFITLPPTQEECETMANYILWGKNVDTGLNAKQEGSIQLQSKYGDWDTQESKVESLDALMESPTFNENNVYALTAPHYSVKKETFSRDKTLAQCPSSMVTLFRGLWEQIDELDLKINYYDLQHGKRIKQPREALLRKFGEEEQRQFQEQVTHWSQFTYLKQRHHLVELRREQYTLRDSFVGTIQSNPTYTLTHTAPDWDAGVEVLPLGTFNKNAAARLVFQDLSQLVPQNFGEEELKIISKLYWEKQTARRGEHQLWFDFRELEHVYELLGMYYELDLDATEENELFDSNTGGLMRALKFYIDMAELDEVQQRILDLKLRKVKNDDIVYEVNKTFGKKYTSNYISTIFRQRIIPKINDAAKYHEQIIANLSFEEEFKTCTCCGRTLLRIPENFTRKARSKDGFTNKCKKCEKAARQGR